MRWCVVLGALCSLVIAAHASQVSVVAAANYSYYGVGVGYGIGMQPPPVVPLPPVVLPLAAPPPAPPPDPPKSGGVLAPANNGITIAGSYDSLLSGNGITYSLTGLLSSLTGNSLTLTGNAPMTFSNYGGKVPTGNKITGATLNLDFLVGSLNMALANSQPQNPYFTPLFAGNLGNLALTLSAGNVSRILTGPSVTSYDLFANGFGAAIAGGAPLTISFSVTDQVSAVTSYSPPNCYCIGGMPAVSTPLSEVLVFNDTRNIVLQNGGLTLYTAPEAITASFEAPEPVSAGLMGCGLLLLGFLRRRVVR